jgi:hypothetical protein
VKRHNRACALFILAQAAVCEAQQLGAKPVALPAWGRLSRK